MDNTLRNLVIRRPNPSDARGVYELIRDSQTLDLNSAYAYLVLCDYFRETCVIVEVGSRVVGFLSAFRSPLRPDTLFVWQVAVAGSHRKQGISKRMLTYLLTKTAGPPITYLEATISRSNLASTRLFTGLAKAHDVPIEVTTGYQTELFPMEIQHEEEPLYRIGPFTPQP
ncbi:diaminobutyrate acetyltransferase [Paenibacillus rubinfantis]|uniref:diaminobutyrate acetyltransferase n=1 Tax=Paenibacillus rubinfantis TaxID=1720296 RepID=UPI00073F76F4|nr:diaminobutyrate acetyltransferase [Paenibacillus rubinfantis]